MHARGQALPPIGSVEDRVLREMVFRERAERVAHVRAIATIAARLIGADVDRVLGDVVAEYASEVFQEGYDPAMLARKAARLREERARIRRRMEEDRRMVHRLERMEKLGQNYDTALGRGFDQPVPVASSFKPLKHKLKSDRG